MEKNQNQSAQNQPQQKPGTGNNPQNPDKDKMHDGATGYDENKEEEQALREQEKLKNQKTTDGTSEENSDNKEDEPEIGEKGSSIKQS